MPMHAFVPVLIPPASFVDATVELDGDAEAKMEDSRDVSDEVGDGAGVVCDMVVDAAVVLLVTAIVYPAAK